MKTHDFYFDLPEELIAQTPIPDRDRSRLLVIGKQDIDPEAAEKIREIYTRSGFSVFVLSAREGCGDLRALRAYIHRELPQKTAAFAGASGVGKSTLMNALFEGFALETGEVSRRIEPFSRIFPR